MKVRATLAVVAFAVAAAAAQTPAPRPAPKPAAAPKFKAIWEPVPFNQDIDLNAIACVGPETCWAVGAKSTILRTEDGGTTWQVQLGGDPESTDDDLTHVSVLDATHAWAMTGRGKVLGTSDGATWSELSTVSGTSGGVWFTSPSTGVEFENADSTTQSTVQRTENGGKTWTPAWRCGLNAMVGGLPRKLPCRLFSAQFLSPSIGFAGGEAAANMGTSLSVFGRTADGGHAWEMAVIPDATRRVTGVHFWTENDGLAVLDNGEEVHWTADGGANWTKAVKPRLWPAVYGAGEGKIIVGIGQGGGIGYSFNGGRTFTSRPLTLPARVRAVTFADARHGYLVGQHAMAYRYRIVPIDYSRPGMLAAMAP